MIKRVIEISQQSAHLCAQNGQLELRFSDGATESAYIPCEDIGIVVVDNKDMTYSHHALQQLMECGAVIVFCGPNHLPAGMLTPWSGHTALVTRLHQQIAASKPLKKRLWQQIIAAKICAQADNLPTDIGPARHLRAMARRVRSGDPNNVEARAAKVYWQAWRPDNTDDFRRNADGKDALNVMLNYGYAVIRAAVAKALVGAGLHPALGIHHAHRSNAFCLADDVMEPLRPLVDARVKSLYEADTRELLPQAKRELLSVLTQTVRTDDTTGPLMTSLERVAASLAQCYGGEERNLTIPEIVRCNE